METGERGTSSTKVPKGTDTGGGSGDVTVAVVRVAPEVVILVETVTGGVVSLM